MTIDNNHIPCRTEGIEVGLHTLTRKHSELVTRRHQALVVSPSIAHHWLLRISLSMSTQPWVFWHGCFSSHGSIIDSTKQCHILIWIDRSLPLRVHAGYESGMHLPRSRTQHRWLALEMAGWKLKWFHYSLYFGTWSTNYRNQLDTNYTPTKLFFAIVQNGWLEAATSPP